ncbi:aldo/keto reductase [Clostridiisalibacter paucivorans]|uniref:aldo/keto reductase n=1 Tax=Clostridiisalibacter paucivorans TaxID=408753 RepID=UPI00047D796C|nr:aldo/keto reductase [Clostridiisalibacter paucivorans]
MEINKLGNTNIEVSKICYGSLTISPLQANLGYEEAGKLIKYGFEKGIKFIDTAELYDNYKHIKEALKYINRKDFVIVTKSYSYSKETAKNSLRKALKELDTDYIDIFLLHEQESELTFKGHYEAIEYFIEAKKRGIIRAFGISTHRIEAVKDSLKYDEIEIIHPIINKLGLGIQDGSIDKMLSYVKKAYDMGKGIYGMKPLGGGHLIKSSEEAFNFVNNLPFLHSIAVGMQSMEEIDANVEMVTTGKIPIEIKERLNKKTRKLHISDWCIGCGNCVNTCKHGGIKIENGKAVCIPENCVFCGYCAKNCPEFCIKVI